MPVHRLLPSFAALLTLVGAPVSAQTNLWYNPDGAIGVAPAQPVYNDALSIYGPTRWVSQQATLTPYVTTERTVASDGSTAVRMLNGYEAKGSTAIGTGTKSFTVAPGLNFVAGFPVTAVPSADLSKSMTGTVASYSGTTVTLTITSSTGSGTFADWVIGRDGKTNQGQTKLTPSSSSSVGSTTLTFASTAGVQVGASVESGADSGIAPRTYVVSTTSTTVTLSAPVISPGVGTLNEITFYGDQGVFLFQDVNAVEGVGFKYGTAEARDAYLSFDVRASGTTGTASIMFLGYNTASTLARAFVQEFPVTATETRVTIRIPGDTVGAANTWRTGYPGNAWGGLWGALGFSWESQGTPTSANIQPGTWVDATKDNPGFNAAGSANQTFDLTHTIGAWVEVSDVKLELDKPTLYVPPTSFAYPVPTLAARAPSLPRVTWSSTSNGPDLKKWQSYILGEGSLGFAKLTDAENADALALRLYADGTVAFPAYPAGVATITAGGVIGVVPGWTAYTPSVSAFAGSGCTFGTTTGEYQRIGNIIFVHLGIDVIDNGTCSGQILTSLPAGLPAASPAEWTLTGGDTGISGKLILGRVVPGTTGVQVRNADATYPAVTGSKLNLSGFYVTP